MDFQEIEVLGITLEKEASYLSCSWRLVEQQYIIYTTSILSSTNADYGSTGCRVFKRGVQNWKYICLKINIPKGNY